MASPTMDSEEVPARSSPSSFELLITCNPPILQSLLAQVPTDTIFRLYQTSYCLRDFLTKSPTSWRYISWRLYQPTISNAAAAANGIPLPRQSSNYALDQILLNIINPFSTRLVSLELDNTAVSGATLTSTVLILRRDTLRHVSVRGCKNVSLKYHINPWLQMHALARESQSARGPTGFETLALESLYTYRCRHHRRRPYLPSSLSRKESDSEPTHELVNTCHKLGIWTDTAWCTTPGARCFRRRGYVKMRMPQGTREVWVVYDRLWRSRNWLGPIESTRSTGPAQPKKRKMDGRSWEFDEEGINGEAIGVSREGKATPAHLRQTHRSFVEDIVCHNCSAEILERCEQCSVMMHCTGCRKTLCASCAFDRPYLRNKNAPEEERNKYWWAPGYAVSPCTMQDHDQPANAAIVAQNADPTMLPNIKFRWCCTEPVFSGGGGITFGNTNSRETDKIRAAPLPIGKGWEDPEFGPERPDVEDELVQQGPGGRWPSIDSFFQTAETLGSNEPPSFSIPRVLCDECYSAEHWRLKCKACATALCLKHDIGDRMKTRICGYRDVVVERQDYKSRQKALKLLATLVRHRKERLAAEKPATEQDQASSSTEGPSSSRLAPPNSQLPSTSESLTYGTEREEAADTPPVGFEQTLRAHRAPLAELDLTHRPLSPASTSTGPLSRSTSPTPSFHSTPATPEPSTNSLRPGEDEAPALPIWQGCQAFFCPATRAPGDHRRRCPAIMKQCFECRVNVCGDCVSTLEPPCPCKGCRPHQTEDQVSSPEPAPLFFCPNCRWGRMESGKCKRRSEAFLTAQSSSRKMKKRRDRIRKPVEERRLGGPTSPSSAEEAIDGLVEFFTSLHATTNRTSSPQPPPGESRPSTSNQQNPPPAANRPPSMQAVLASLPMPTGVPMGTLHAHRHHHHQRHILPPHLNEFQELEDMGLLARDLIRRIQRLRDQYRPGSLAAIALPDVRIYHNDNNTAAGPVAAQAPPPRPVANPQPRPQQQNGNAVAGPPDPVPTGNNEEIDDRESGTDEEEED